LQNIIRSRNLWRHRAKANNLKVLMARSVFSARAGKNLGFTFRIEVLEFFRFLVF